MVQLGGFLSRLLGPLLKTGLLLIRNIFKPLAIISFGALRVNSNSNNRCSYSKENLKSGMTSLIISNEEMDDIVKIVKSLEESGLLIKGVSETIKNEQKEEKG